MYKLHVFQKDSTGVFEFARLATAQSLFDMTKKATGVLVILLYGPDGEIMEWSCEGTWSLDGEKQK